MQFIAILFPIKTDNEGKENWEKKNNEKEKMIQISIRFFFSCLWFSCKICYISKGSVEIYASWLWFRKALNIRNTSLVYSLKNRLQHVFPYFMRHTRNSFSLFNHDYVLLFMQQFMLVMYDLFEPKASAENHKFNTTLRHQIIN